MVNAFSESRTSAHLALHLRQLSLISDPRCISHKYRKEVGRMITGFLYLCKNCFSCKELGFSIQESSVAMWRICLCMPNHLKPNSLTSNTVSLFLGPKPRFCQAGSLLLGDSQRATSSSQPKSQPSQDERGQDGLSSLGSVSLTRSVSKMTSSRIGGLRTSTATSQKHTSLLYRLPHRQGY